MKKLSTRALALFLALLFVFTASFTAFAATETKVTKNYGNRVTVCTSLSSQAIDYYADNDALYSDLDDLSSSTLLTELRTLMGTGTSGTHKKTTSYDDCKNYADETDCENGGNNVSLIYTGILADWDDNSASAPGWNREHVWPKSLGGFENSGPGADLHHIRPSDVTNNSNRDNRKYGEVTNGTISSATITSDYLGNSISSDVRVGGTYNSTYYEPTDDFKGDVARICLYVYVRYGASHSKCSTITNVFQSVEVLLEWCALDPVDTWEMGRNDVVEGIQGNRNVFIDYPELAWQLFGRSTPANLTTPSGNTGSTGGTGSGSGNTGSGNTGTGSGTTTTPAVAPLTELKTGDVVVIGAPAYGKVLSMTKATSNTNYNAGVNYSATNFANITDDELFVVTKNSDGTYTFTSKSGKTVAMADQYNSLNETGANSKWTLEAKSGAEGIFYLKNTVRGNYIEWYAEKDNWSTYNTDTLSDLFELSFYKLDGNTGSGSGNTGNEGGTGSGTGSGTTTTTGTVLTELKTGDVVVIGAPAYGKVLSMTKATSNEYYNAGVDYSATNFANITDDEIFVVTKNSDGTYTFTSKSGKTVAMAADYNSLNETGANTKWTLEAKSGAEGIFYLKNTARGNYLEWYADRDNWSTHTPETLSDLFEISFYVLTTTETEEPDNNETETPGGSTNTPSDEPTEDSTNTPSDSTTTPDSSTDNESDEELGFFARLIKAIREFFAKLFGKKTKE